MPVVVAAHVMVPLYVTVKFAETRVILPYIDHAEEPARVITPSSAPPAPPKLISLHTAPVEMVTVNAPVPVLEPASKITSSASVGADAPVAPPDRKAPVANPKTLELLKKL